MSRFVSTILIVFCLLLLPGGAGAQSIPQPILAYRDGDIWRYDLQANTATQLTDWGYNGGPILSPDGRKIAYLSTAAEFIARYEARSVSQNSGTAPGNIWVMDIATESFQLVADQTGASDAGYLRSLPDWSPDSRQLAWLQIDPNRQDLDTASLQVYSLDDGRTGVLHSNVNLGHQGSHIRMPSIRWGEGGIAWLLFTYLTGDENPFLFIEFLNPAAGAAVQYNLGLNANRDNTVRDFEWVNHGGRALMALQIQDYWELLDPATGNRTRLQAPPRLRNRFLAGGLQLIPTSVAVSGGGWRIHWYAAAASGLYDTGYRSARVNRIDRPGLSSDGAQMVWHNGDRISTWHIGISDINRGQASDAGSGQAFPIPQPASAVWAPTEWVTTGVTVVDGQAAASASCGLPPRLNIGMRAMVSPGLANRVRSGATLSAGRIGAIQAGEVVSVEAGPVCADGYNWYYVRNANIAGWTVEGADGEYWLLHYAG